MLSLPPLLALVLASQSPARLDLAAPIRGRWLDESGAPLIGWEVGAETTSVSVGVQLAHGKWRGTVRTDRNGCFRLDPNPGPAFLLVARAPDESAWAIREDFWLDGEEIVLRLQPEDRASAFLEGALTGPWGPVTDAGVSMLAGDSLEWLFSESFESRFRVGPLRPGTYLACAFAADQPKYLTPVSLAADTTLDLGTLRFPTPGWVAATHEHIGAPLARDEAVTTWVLDANGVTCGWIENGERARFPVGQCGLMPTPPGGYLLGRSGPLAPGRYLLRTRELHDYAPDRFVDVEAGRTTSVVIQLEPATLRTLVAHVPQRDPSTRMRLSVESSAGVRIYTHESVYRRKDNFCFAVEGLTFGRYRFTASTPAGSTCEGEFEVTTLEDETTFTDVFLR